MIRQQRIQQTNILFDIQNRHDLIMEGKMCPLLSVYWFVCAQDNEYGG